MKEYSKMRSSTRPQDIEITETAVYIAKNITPFEENLDGRIMSGFEYNCTEYTKDEYLAVQSAKMASLEEELQAAKILLGVD